MVGDTRKPRWSAVSGPIHYHSPMLIPTSQVALLFFLDDNYKPDSAD